MLDDEYPENTIQELKRAAARLFIQI